MPASMGIVALPLLVFAAGLGGYSLLLWLGHDEAEAWSAGRLVGLVAAAFPAWWLGVAGLAAWRTVAVALLLALAAVGAVTAWSRRAAWRTWLAAEAPMAVGALFVLWIRLGNPQILGTEKPMDLGILASLLRAEGFPPPDMWLAGESLPYYYWGALVWVAPLEAGRVPLEVGYNLIVALLGGLTAGLLWTIGKRLSGSSGAGWLAVAAGMLAGTPRGLWQLLDGRPLAGLDLWAASRQVTDTITEWPLFTFWLGDLHPHLLSLPLALGATVAAARAGERPAAGPLTLTAVLFGVTWAANPWALPPTLAAVALMILVGEHGLHLPWASPRRWLAAAAVAVVGWLAAAPFHLAYHPPFEGLGLVHARTAPLQLLMWGGVVLVPAGMAAFALLREGIGGGRERSLAVALAATAAAAVVGAATDRPTLVLVGMACVVLATSASGAGAARHRQALGFAALGLFLVAVPEVVFVRDPYGADLHRMNTVFKAYFMAWVMLAVALPALVERAVRDRRGRRVLAAALLLAAAPHPLGMVWSTARAQSRSLDGLGFMSEGDREAVEHLRLEPPGTTLLEAVGGAYTEYARLSAASGVPALLGWANHEGVWRGHSINPETDRRRQLATRVYTCGDPEEIRRLVREEGIDLVALGALERRDFPAESLDAVASAGRVVFDRHGTRLVSFREESVGGG